MDRIDKILNHDLFLYHLGRNNAAEADRRFCRHGMVHFLEKMRAEFLPQIESECSDVPEKYRPYLEEFHIYTSISLFRLWMKRKKDLSKEELFGLIHTLYNKGYMGVCEKS